MPQERLSMQKIKTVLRLAGLGLSQRQIALSCQVGQATVSDYLRMAAAAGLNWPDIADWDEDQLRTALAPASIPAPSWRKTDDPDYAEIRRELQTHKHLTLQLLWQEYREQQPNGYGYSRYVAAEFMLRDHLNPMTDARSGDIDAT